MFLKHKAIGKVRLLMRKTKTLKICTNHLKHAGNEKSCVWHARDFADGEIFQVALCIRFPSIENMARALTTPDTTHLDGTTRYNHHNLTFAMSYPTLPHWFHSPLFPIYIHNMHKAKTWE